MSISFIRVDDRMIHGQTCTRWALEYPCDGLIAVNDKAATTPVLKAIMQKGYEVEFALIKEAAIGNWKKFRGQFGY